MFASTCNNTKCHAPLTMRFYLNGKAVCAHCYFKAMKVPEVKATAMTAMTMMVPA